MWKLLTKLTMALRIWTLTNPLWMVTSRSQQRTLMSCLFEANVAIREVQQWLSPSFTWVVCSQSMFEMTNHCNKSRSGVPVKHLENPGHCPVNLQPVLSISATIWSGVNSPGFNWRYYSQVLHLLGGSEDPGWTLTFLIKPLGWLVAPPFV